MEYLDKSWKNIEKILKNSWKNYEKILRKFLMENHDNTNGKSRKIFENTLRNP
jgi:hypothetical protein